MDKKKLSETDIRTKFITPAIVGADAVKIEGRQFAVGEIILDHRPGAGLPVAPVDGPGGQALVPPDALVAQAIEAHAKRNQQGQQEQRHNLV